MGNVMDSSLFQTTILTTLDSPYKLHKLLSDQTYFSYTGLTQTVPYIGYFIGIYLLYRFSIYFLFVLCNGYNRISNNKMRSAQEQNRFDEGLKRRAAGYPQSFPMGWFAVCDSSEISKEGVKEIHLFNVHALAVFRTAEGRLLCVDGYCPHMGANMAVGGVVEGNCIKCPFHSWSYDGDSGKCTNIPYLKPGGEIPSLAKVQTWHVCERFGLVLVWYHPRKFAPTYTIPDIPGLAEGRTVFGGRLTTSTVMHLQEFCENSVDFPHFAVMHAQLMLPFSTKTFFPGNHLEHDVGWSAKGHQATMTNKTTLFVMNKKFPFSSGSDVQFYGPGSVVVFTFFTPLGKIWMVHTHTPLQLMEQEVRFVWFAEWWLPKLLVWYYTGSWVAQWRQDVPIWTNKVFRAKPILIREDGPVMKMRRWYTQFYDQPLECTDDD